MPRHRVLDYYLILIIPGTPEYIATTVITLKMAPNARRMV